MKLHTIPIVVYTYSRYTFTLFRNEIFMRILFTCIRITFYRAGGLEKIKRYENLSTHINFKREISNCDSTRWYWNKSANKAVETRAFVLFNVCSCARQGRIRRVVYVHLPCQPATQINSRWKRGTCLTKDNTILIAPDIWNSCRIISHHFSYS